ncbi:MAG: NAD-dependent epimerase/dehydratase family protein [Brevinema sp.]
MSKKILITGVLGQIGSELLEKCADVYGVSNVVGCSWRKKGSPLEEAFPFEVVDVRDIKAYGELLRKHKPSHVIHLASKLSAVGEQNPQELWDINMVGLYNTLELAREYKCAVFTPSSIAAFGHDTPANDTPQDTVMRPSTIYGVSKVAGELLCDYYFQKYGVDTRGMRFPGLISWKTAPGGGTTDYAVDIYFKAAQGLDFSCPLNESTYMDMMYMDDAVDSTLQLMEADASKLKHRNAFNVSAMSFSPKEISAEIKKRVPNFKMSYELNPVLQAIADSWPNSMDCSAAKEEWGFSPRFDLSRMTDDMLKNLQK